MRKELNVFVTLFLFLMSLPIQAQWITKKPLSIARQEMQGVIHGREIYIAGGISLVGITISDMEIYNIDADKWTTGPTMPQPRHHHAMAIWENKIYVIGGYKDVLFKPRSEMYIYDIPSARWSIGTPLPTPIGAGDAVAYNGKVYFFGGTDGENASRAVYIYDIATTIWSMGADMPTAREHLAVDVIDGLIYVVAGRGSDFASTRMEIYNPETNQWDAGVDLPTARSGIDAVAIQGKLHVLGGEGGGVHAEYEVYDPVLDQWEIFPPLPTARHGLAVVASGDTLFAIAGATMEGYGPSKVNEAFILSPLSSSIPDRSALSGITAYHDGEAVHLYMFSQKALTAQIQMYSLSGALLYNRNQMLMKGENHAQLNIPELPTGIYQISIFSGGFRKNIKIYIRSAG